MIIGGIIYQNVRKVLRPESVTNRKFVSLEVIIQYPIYLKLNRYCVSIMYENADANNLDKKIFVNNIPCLLIFL